MDNEQRKQLNEILNNPNNKIVFFGGAGVSTESGIPDFRSADGLYNQESDDGLSPEFKLSNTYFRMHRKDFYDFYRKHLIPPAGVKPNAAHYALAKLEQLGRLTGVVTQNIDGLHQAAGSKKVFEIHGSVHRNFCTRCGKEYPMSAITESTGIPVCDVCGEAIKPGIVLYEEQLPADVVRQAQSAIDEANVMIVGGTSLNVYPAAAMAGKFDGTLIIMNNSPTPFDSYATMVVRGKIGENFSMLNIK